MDIPVFHLDILNNRVLIGLIATLHVIINHGMAVGGIPLVVFLEWRAHRTGDAALERTAERVLRSFFIVTTSLGALTGVGIWFSASLVNPYAIASLIRVFFWTWFVEWLVFVTEVVLILFYYLTWEKWVGANKARHIKLGLGLAIASWATMALIVSILGFMMDPGSWHTDRTLFSGMLNPVYLPQLAFRTPLAMLMAGTYGLVCSLFCAPDAATRDKLTRLVGRWTLAWLPPTVLGGLWYAGRIPDAMRGNLPVALLTQALEAWASQAQSVLLAAAVVLALVVTVRAPRALAVVPALLSMLLLGTFERVREFIRKPYAIAGYLYSNGFREADYPILKRDGLLTHATYTPFREITDENELEAGREVFRLACTRCHTVDAVNGVRGLLSRMYGEESRWNADAISSYVGTMHNARAFMPPFPGSDRERDALALYLADLQRHSEVLEGAQSIGAVTPDEPPPSGARLAARP
jgi:Cytochrome C oxidase, cbb3-type, subunit III